MHTHTWLLWGTEAKTSCGFIFSSWADTSLWCMTFFSSAWTKLCPQCESFLSYLRVCSVPADLVLLLLGKSEEQKYWSCPACGLRKVAPVLAAQFRSLGDLILKYVRWELKNQSQELKAFKLTASTGFQVLILPRESLPFFPLADGVSEAWSQDLTCRKESSFPLSSLLSSVRW